MAAVITIPQTTLPVGPGSVQSNNVPNDVFQYFIRLTQVAWPHAGDLAFVYQCEVSQDNGQSWSTSSAGDVYDAPIPARGTVPANEIRIACPIPNVGNNQRRLRFSYDFAKTLTVSGTVEAN
jgi:hypothetical protein